jgi:putative transposase
MKPPIEYGKFYHIYNRGNNYENIFGEETDYRHFLNLYNIFIDSVADTYAWCLMKNHFHFLLRIREEDEIGYLNSSDAKSEDLDKKWKVYFPENGGSQFTKKPNPTEQLKHLFGTYSIWFNKKYNRRGSLFEKNFERIPVNDKYYFTRLIVYIHNNPVKHGFTEHAMDYPWSSYLSITSTRHTKLKREEVIDYFDDLENFKYMHNSGCENDEGMKGLIVE